MFTRICLLALTILLSLSGPAAANDAIAVIPKADWPEKVWKAGSTFTNETIDGIPVLAVQAKNAGTIKGGDIKIDVTKYPQIDFLWAAQSTLRNRNEGLEAENDFAARILIMLVDTDGSVGSLSYAWSSSLPVGTWLTSPFTRARFLVVRSGPAQSATLEQVTRNLLQDAKDGLGMKAPRVVNIAIMSDTDQTGESTQAWYGRIRFAQPDPVKLQPREKGTPIS